MNEFNSTCSVNLVKYESIEGSATVIVSIISFPFVLAQPLLYSQET